MENWKYRVLRVIQIYSDYKMGVYAGNATLFIVTGAAPFIMLIISIVNLLPGYSPQDVTDILFQLLPDLSSIRKLVESLVVNLKNQSGGLLTSVAAVTTLWSASAGVGAIQKGLDVLDGGETTGGIKGIRKRIVFTVMLVILIPALLMIEMLGDSIARLILDSLKKINPAGMESIQSWVESFFGISPLVVAVFALLVILEMYAKMPATRRTLRSQLPGALFTGIGWLVFTELFSFFIPRFYHASSLYGSLASIFLLLLWCRFVMSILFLGGALNRALEEEQGEIDIED
jgi:membrane protein